MWGTSQLTDLQGQQAAGRNTIFVNTRPSTAELKSLHHQRA
jgi:hypothetical protein